MILLRAIVICDKEGCGAQEEAAASLTPKGLAPQLPAGWGPEVGYSAIAGLDGKVRPPALHCGRCRDAPRCDRRGCQGFAAADATCRDCGEHVRRCRAHAGDMARATEEHRRKHHRAPLGVVEG